MLAETPVLEIQRSTKAILRLKTADGFEGGFTLKYCKGRLLVSVPAPDLHPNLSWAEIHSDGGGDAHFKACGQLNGPERNAAQTNFAI